MVAAGILVTSLILYAVITPESWHVKKSSAIDPATHSGAPAGQPAPAPTPGH